MTIGSYEKFSDMHTPLNQREAGIDHLEWMHSESQETWGRIFFEAACYGLFFLACYYILPVLTGVVWSWWIGQ